MNKELFVASTPHETRIALSEDGELTEVYYEREREYSLAGSIYKGRVTRVLPGMQSAFVDIGLERDAFLYVSDFFEDVEEYDRVVSEAERAAEANGPAAAAPAAFQPAAQAPAAGPSAVEPAIAPAEGERQDERGGRFPGRRRRGRHGRQGFPEAKFARPEGDDAVPPATGEEISAPSPAAERRAPEKIDYPFVLPGESLAKYQSGRPAEAEAGNFTAGEQRAEFEHERMQPDSPVEAAAAESGDAAPPPAHDLSQEAAPSPADVEAESVPAESWFEGDESEAEEEFADPASGEGEEHGAAPAAEQAEAEGDQQGTEAGEHAELRERQPRADFQVRAETTGRRRRRGR
ncbi:MAG: hypothetical protein ACRD2H_05485, partial [Terriglobales bacterium]